MKSISLPIIENPPIISYQHHAYYLGILFTNSDYHHQFYSSYINLYYNRNESNQFNFVLEKWYAEESYFIFNKIGYSHSLDLIPKNELVDIIIKMLNLGYYVLGDYDEYYIPGRRAHNTLHFKHDFMIHGYCKEREEFDLIGYTGYTNRDAYGKSKVSFSNFMTALYLDSLSWIDFVKIDRNYNFKFDIEQTKNHICDYLYSKNTYHQYGNDYCSFGISAVADFANDMASNYDLLDLRYLRILFEHKVCMHLRINYLCENSYINNKSIYEKYAEVVEKHQMIFALSIKSIIKPNADSLTKIRDYIISTIDIEKHILEDVLMELG